MARRSCSGFTLVEMAVVVVIMGLVMMTVLPALNTVRSANQLSLTQSNLRSLMLATAAYVQANGCLPCPAVPGGTNKNFGRVGYYTGEDTPSPPIACGDCSSAPQGIPPFASLGIPASTAHDGWGHWITMRVDPALTNPDPVFVPPTASCTADDVSMGRYGCTVVGIGSYKGLCKAGLSAANRVVVTTPKGGGSQEAAVIFVSHGQAGYGSYVATPKKVGDSLSFPTTYAACSPTSGFARCNADNNAQFYDAAIVIDNSSKYTYDDVLAYADRNTLVSMFGNGACNTTWSSP
ncbi:MAG: type II secretion system protein [Bdellovibrionales bacterium]